ncbi:MAG: hypothetical protein ACFB16_05380 [Phormidesmis sp.]
MAVFGWQPAHRITNRLSHKIVNRKAINSISNSINHDSSNHNIATRAINRTVALGIALLTFGCSTQPFSGQMLALAEEEGSVCTLNESVTNSSGRYSTNVDLTASIALPGETGVDVVMTSQGAIAATNTETGALLHWVDPATGEIVQTVELPNPISDIAFDGRDVLAVATANTLLRLSAADGETLSRINLRGAKRVAISSDGHLAAIAGKRILAYDDNNQEMFSTQRDYREVTDVEILSCDDKQMVYFTSYRNATFTDINDRTNPVQIARIEALDFTGEVQWDLFGDDTETIKQNVADTRLYRVVMAPDGYLYIAGESAGTATIFRWRGQPMTEDEQFGRISPFLSRIDESSSLHNSGAAHLAYYARVHPTEGRLVTAQMSFPRNVDTKANAMRIGDIDVSANGTLYFGGAASRNIPNREELTLNGVSVGEYGGRDRAWMSVAPDFQARNFWTVLAEEGGKGIVKGVGVGYGYSAALSNVESGTVPVTAGEQEGSVFLSFTAE